MSAENVIAVCRRNAERFLTSSERSCSTRRTPKRQQHAYADKHVNVGRTLLASAERRCVMASRLFLAAVSVIGHPSLCLREECCVSARVKGLTSWPERFSEEESSLFARILLMRFEGRLLHAYPTRIKLPRRYIFLLKARHRFADVLKTKKQGEGR